MIGAHGHFTTFGLDLIDSRRGEAEIAVTLMSEIVPIKGAWLAAPVPPAAPRHLGGSKPAAFRRSTMAGPLSAAMKARALAGSPLLAGMAAA